jgi:pimeloyl-ACP methyl ester carboxylesterase
MHVKVPMEYISGAANYLDKYGPDEKYDVMKYIDKIGCPVLAIAGTEEVARRFGFDGLPEGFQRAQRTKPNLTYLSVPGGDHLYTDKQEWVLQQVLDWLRGLAGAGQGDQTADTRQTARSGS